MEVRERRDVEFVSELGSAPEGWRWIEFFGSVKRFQGFLVPRVGLRRDFMKENADLLDPVVQPVYEDARIQVAVDPTWAVPGNFVIVQKVMGGRPDQSSLTLDMQETLAARYVAAGLSAVGIHSILQTRWNETKPHSVPHTWILPYFQGRPGAGPPLSSNSLASLEPTENADLATYLHSFRFAIDGSEVRRIRNYMVEFLEQTELGKKMEVLGDKVNALALYPTDSALRQPSGLTW